MSFLLARPNQSKFHTDIDGEEAEEGDQKVKENIRMMTPEKTHREHVEEDKKKEEQEEKMFYDDWNEPQIPQERESVSLDVPNVPQKSAIITETFEKFGLTDVTLKNNVEPPKGTISFAFLLII